MYYGARYYSPELARFISPDKVATFNPQKILKDPQRLNGYSYTSNNPINRVDPDGNFWWKEFYTDWDGYDIFRLDWDNGLILKMGEVLGGRFKALYEINSNAAEIQSASKRTGVSQELIKGIIYEEQSHQFPPMFGESIYEFIFPDSISGGIGVMQVSSETSGLSNKKLLNSKTNIMAGASILANNAKQYSSNQDIATRYNNKDGIGVHANKYGARVNQYVNNGTYNNIYGILDKIFVILGNISAMLKNSN